MALASLNTAIPWPGVCTIFSGTPTATTRATLSAAGHYDAAVFVAREDMVITHIGFRNGAVAGSPTADLRIETVDASGVPNGLWAANTNIVTGTLTANTWNLAALTASASITKGQMFCVKIAFNSGTSFITQDAGGFTLNTGLPFSLINTASLARARITSPLLAALGSSSTTFYQVDGLLPFNTFAANAFNNTSSAKRGLRFQVPFKCRAVGLRFWDSNSTGDFNIALLDDSGAELSSSSTAVDGDSNAQLATGPLRAYFDNTVTLSPGTWYRASLEPSSATNITIGTMALPSSNYRSALPGGTNCLYTTYTSGGGWSDSATDTIPVLDILIDQLDDGASAGGSTSYVIGGG